MKSKVVSLLVLFVFFSNQAFAICEQEREEYADWNSKCETLCASSATAGTVGGIFAIVTFGASMAPCAALIAAAANACRIRDEKRDNLTRCQNFHAENTRQAEALVQQKKIKVDGINASYAAQREALINEYARRLDAFMAEYREEGWDTESPESQEHLRQVRVSFENELNTKLDKLEEERKKEVQSA